MGIFDNVANKVTGAFMKSGFLMAKTVGMSCGFTARCAQGVYDGTKQLVRFDIVRPKKFKGLFTGGLRKKYALNKSEVKARIAFLENSIRELYLEIGKMGSQATDNDKFFEEASVAQLMERISAQENEVNSLKKFLVKMEQTENSGSAPDDFLLEPGQDGKLQRRLKGTIESCIRKAKFSLRSDAIVFRKALYDLLDDEMELKRLAVSELGRIGNIAAIPAIKEALHIKDPNMQAEVINVLIQLEDRDAFDICKHMMKNDFAGIRLACIRGLYKLGRDRSIPFLIEALKDENVEARNSAVIFLGWLEAKEAIAPLLQAARDGDARVRKSAITSLSNIRDESAVLPLIRLLDDDEKEIRVKIVEALRKISGEDIKFNVDVNKPERQKEIETLKEWWVQKMHSDYSEPVSEPPVENKPEKRKVKQKKDGE